MFCLTIKTNKLYFILYRGSLEKATQDLNVQRHKDRRMHLLGLLGSGIALWVILAPFYSYCLIDSDHPTVEPGSLSITISLTPTVIVGGVAAKYFSENDPSALQYSMIFMGTLYSAAFFDPNRIGHHGGESVARFILRWIIEHLRKAFFEKAVSAIIAATSALTFPKYWNYVGLLLTYHLLYYKMASCIQNEAHVGIFLAPENIQKKWKIRAWTAAITMGLLMVGPFEAIRSRGYVPDSWEAFAGLGFGSLISASSFLFAAVFVAMLRHH